MEFFNMNTHLSPTNLQQSNIATVTAAMAAMQIESWTDLTSKRRRELLSIISCVARMQGLPAELVQLTPAALRDGFLSGSAATFGIGESRMRTIRSGLRLVLSRLDVIDKPDTPLSQAWETLIADLDTFARAGIVALARFCSSRLILPEMVTEATLADFRIWLTERTITVKPAKLTGTTRAAWNRLVTHRQGWPGRQLAAPGVEGQYILPLDAFTDALQADILLFGTRLQATPLDDIFAATVDDAVDDGAPAYAGPPKPLRRSSAEGRMAHARWAASALVATGTPIESLTTLNDLVQPTSNAKAILRFLHTRAGGKPSASGTHVGDALRMIAKYHAHLPASDIDKIKRWGKALALDYNGMTRKNQLTVENILQPQREQKLLALPGVLMQAAYALRASSPREAAGLAQCALAIEFLSRIPLRLANLIGLRLDRHLHHTDPKQRAYSHIRIPADETKTGHEILVPVSATVNHMLMQWSNDFRGIVASPTCAFLFPGHGTGDVSITPQGLRNAVKHRTRRHTGVTITPHQFRHIAARRFLDEHPGEYETVRQLLGHKSVETTLRHYAGDGMAVSAERFDELINQKIKRPGLDQRSARHLAKAKRLRPAPAAPSPRSKGRRHD
jgi:integrase